MWRIGQVARMAGISERTLRHYEKLGLITPAAVHGTTGYRWYGVDELARLDRIRGLQRLGLSLRQIGDLADAGEHEVRRVVADTVAALRRDLATLTASVEAAENHLAAPSPLLPRETETGPRRLRVRRLRVGDPADLRALCARTLLTWLHDRPDGEFDVAITVDRGGEPLLLPARTVVRTHVPSTLGVVGSGTELFTWLRRHGYRVAGPTLEEHLTDADGRTTTVLEIPVTAASSGTTPVR